MLLHLGCQLSTFELVPQLGQLVPTEFQAIVAELPQVPHFLAHLGDAVAQALPHPVAGGEVCGLLVKPSSQLVELNVLQARTVPHLLLVFSTLSIPLGKFDTEAFYKTSQVLLTLDSPLQRDELMMVVIAGHLALLDSDLHLPLPLDRWLNELQDVLPQSRLDLRRLSQHRRALQMDALAPIGPDGVPVDLRCDRFRLDRLEGRAVQSRN
mmetsp:Transcript_36608/g.93277  ORF Transcript_36608/g.93277 Transcript_36608/m.93277 type:complete len:210 (+) Transcript_36608:1162-1791(+)